MRVPCTFFMCIISLIPLFLSHEVLSKECLCARPQPGRFWWFMCSTSSHIASPHLWRPLLCEENTWVGWSRVDGWAKSVLGSFAPPPPLHTNTKALCRHPPPPAHPFAWCSGSNRGLGQGWTQYYPFICCHPPMSTKIRKCGARISCNPCARKSMRKWGIGDHQESRAVWQLQPTKILGCKGKCLFWAGGRGHISSPPPPPRRERVCVGWLGLPRIPNPPPPGGH